MAQKNKYEVTLEFNLNIELHPQFDELDPEFELTIKNKLKEILTGSIKDMITHVDEIPNDEQMTRHE